MRSADNYARNHLGLPSFLLMENAARSASEIIRKILTDYGLENPKIAILCGAGNNGGDGFAIARHLREISDITVYFVGETEKMSPETLTNFIAAQKHDLKMIHIKEKKDISEMFTNFDVILDALLGVGGSEFPRGIIVPLLQFIENQNKYIKIAIDTPTGLNSDTGIAHVSCFRADFTISMGAIKSGMLLNSGREVCGKIIVADFGIPKNVIQELSEIASLEITDIRRILPNRRENSSKYDFGSISIIAGSEMYSGAGALCANACISSGVGVVRLLTATRNGALLPEIICQKLPATANGTIALAAWESIAIAIKNSSVVVFGPGMGENHETLVLSQKIIEEVPFETTLIIDADGLRAVSLDSKLSKNVILTPHHGEFSRLIGIPRDEVAKNSVALAKEWADQLNCIIVLKNIPTIISDGKKSYWNSSGNAGMASAGSGDVLSGIIASLAGQKVNPLEAAALGVFLHGLAGDCFAEKFNQETLTASKIIEYLKIVIPK